MQKTFCFQSCRLFVSSIFVFQEIFTNTLTLFNNQHINRNIVIFAHQLKNFVKIEYQYDNFIERFTKLIVENICRRHFRVFTIESIERRTRNSFSFVDFDETRIWFDEWAINKTRFKKFVKTFQTIVFHFVSMLNDSIFIENSSNSINDSSINNFFVNDLSNFVKNSTITKEISRDDMIFNSFNFNSFNFDFFDTQRFELTQIIVATLRTNVLKSFFDSSNFFNSLKNENNVDNDNNNNEKWKSNDIEYFDSKFEESINTSNSIVNLNRHIFYRDVYVFVNRLKNLTSLRDENKFRIVISQCFRNTILIWHFIKLSNLKKKILRNVFLNNWYEALIIKFKERVSQILFRLQKKRYSIFNVKKQRNSRLYVQNIFKYVKIVEIKFVFNQIIMIWNNFDWKF